MPTCAPGHLDETRYSGASGLNAYYCLIMNDLRLRIVLKGYEMSQRGFLYSNLVIFVRQRDSCSPVMTAFKTGRLSFLLSLGIMTILKLTAPREEGCHSVINETVVLISVMLCV
jgi:hypothetical protein